MPGMGYRTIKSALGTSLAIWFSQLLQLDFYTSAGIIAILCIQTTKKRSIKSGSDRLFASLIALVLGGLWFETTAYHPATLSILILALTPVLVFLKIQEGFVTSIVITLHVFLSQNFTTDLFLNEIKLLIIGIGTALIINSYMPNTKKKVKEYKEKIEQRFQIVLYEFSAYLKDDERTWEGKELLELEEILNQSKSAAIKQVENHLLRKQDRDYHYFEMRERQYELLTRMMPVVFNLGQYVKQKDIFADFLYYLSKNVHEGNATEASIKRLNECKELIADTALPKTREEFEIRANLFYLINEIENYLEMKRMLFEKENENP